MNGFGNFIQAAALRKPRVASGIIFALLLAACGEGDACSKPDVLTTVKKLFQEKEFGKFYQLPDGIAFVKEKTATFVSTDKQTNAVRCTVVVTVDLLQMLKSVQGFDEEYVSKAKENALKTGQKTQEDTLVSFAVQTVNSGEHFVTLLQ